MKRYLICSRDESVTHCSPKAVIASDENEALTRYLKSVYSKDPEFRESILDLSINMSFVERFYLSTDQEKERFDASADAGTEFEIIESRIKAYFSSRPDLSDKFLRYLKTQDPSFMSDELFEFIAVNESEEEHGFVVIDPTLVEVVA